MFKLTPSVGGRGTRGNSGSTVRVGRAAYSPAMRPARAIEELELLKAEAERDEVIRGGEHFTSWKAKVRGLLSASLGPDDHLLDRFDKVRYSLGFWTENTPESAFQAAQRRGIRDVCRIIEAAVYQLRLLTTDGEEPVDHRSYDPELWEHVKNLVHDEDWGKVASQTAIFAEDRVREWSGDPKSGRGESLVGRELMGRVFSDDSDWRVGSRAAEREAWRALATGFAGALSNVDRHRIQRRDDARRYAVGVLGLGSLLLTQLRHEHGELIEDVQTGADAAD
ncbi:MAG: TIGR02391 family protein [Mycetocola sp.]